MSVITTLNDGITGASFRGQVNTNFANLNTDKVESSTYMIGLATKQDTLVSGTNIKTINGSSVLGSGDLTVSGGASTFLALTDTPSSYTGQALKIAQVNAGETALEFITLVGGGNALTSNPLSQFASTTSAQLAGVMSDETGTGALVFANSPTLVTPVLGAATATTINGATITSGTLNGSVTGTNTGDQTSIVGITGTKAQFDTAVTDGNIVYSGDSPTLGTITTTGNIELGNASDTTISRVSAGKLAVEGVNLGNEGILQNSQSAAYTTVLADAGKHIYHPSADTTARIWTIDSNANVAYPIGTAITFINDVSAGVLTISITSDTLLWTTGAGTGSRTLAAASIATAIKITSTKWIISGSTGLT